jgi:uncharacterized protein YeeX (DUF496 family)
VHCKTASGQALMIAESALRRNKINRDVPDENQNVNKNKRRVNAAGHCYSRPKIREIIKFRKRRWFNRAGALK